MRDSMYARRQRLGEFPSVRLLSFCLCLRTPFTPKYPSGRDTVATSGFPRLSLCFTRVWWTAEFGIRRLVAVRVCSQSDDVHV